MALSGKQRRQLRSLGHHLHPVVIVGQEGVTPGVVAAVQQALYDHELIKVKFNEGPENRKEGAKKLARASESELAQVLGRTALLYRMREENPKIVLVKGADPGEVEVGGAGGIDDVDDDADGAMVMDDEGNGDGAEVTDPGTAAAHLIDLDDSVANAPVMVIDDDEDTDEDAHAIVEEVGPSQHPIETVPEDLRVDAKPAAKAKAKKAAVKSTAKPTTKKAAVKPTAKPTTKKAGAKPTAKKAPAKKAPAKKAGAKPTAKKAPAKKAPAKKAPAKKAPAKTTAKKTSARKSPAKIASGKKKR